MKRPMLHAVILIFLLLWQLGLLNMDVHVRLTPEYALNTSPRAAEKLTLDGPLEKNFWDVTGYAVIGRVVVGTADGVFFIAEPDGTIASFREGAEWDRACSKKLGVTPPLKIPSRFDSSLYWQFQSMLAVCALVWLVYIVLTR